MFPMFQVVLFYFLQKLQTSYLLKFTHKIGNTCYLAKIMRAFTLKPFTFNKGFFFIIKKVPTFTCFLAK